MELDKGGNAKGSAAIPGVGASIPLGPLLAA